MTLVDGSVGATKHMTSTPRNATPLSLPELPDDVFLLFVGILEAWDVVRCRKVCRSWRQAFSAADHLRTVLKKYPLAQEIQALRQSGLLTQPAFPDGVDWQGIHDKVASRYWHLTHGRARSTKKYELAFEGSSPPTHWYAVAPWDYHESQPGGRLYHVSDPSKGDQAYYFTPSFWSSDDGLVVFAPKKLNGSEWGFSTAALVVLDVENEEAIPIPLDLRDKIIRNFRLKYRTLIVEWAEKDAFHALNDSEKVHRHFTTCFDIVPRRSASGLPGSVHGLGWRVVRRSEWKLHFLGLPLNNRDRFFSDHTSRHYAIYFWQPNRSMYAGDEDSPIESLIVWDITQSSTYQPSQDPAGSSKPMHAAAGPNIVSRLSFRHLDHYGVRQHSSPTLMKLSLNSEAGTMTFRENFCIEGQGYFDPAERLWCACTTTFPFQGEGPHLRREWEGRLPPYRGNCSMETADVFEPERWFLGIMDVVDEIANVRFSLIETCFTGRFVKNEILCRLEALEVSATLDSLTTREVVQMGRIGGDERFLIGQNDKQQLVVLKF